MDTFFEQIVAVKKNAKLIVALIGIWLLALLLCFLVFMYSGYIGSIFIPIIGIIIGIYLLTRPNRDVHKHGIIMIVLAIVLSIISIMIFFLFYKKGKIY